MTPPTHPTPSLGRRVASGATWMVLFRLIDRSMGLISTVILARLLIPADFGLVAMATAIIAVLDVLSTFSFDLALIQNQRAEKRHFDTAWTFQASMGMVNAAILVLLAGPASSFYAEPRLAEVMRWLALGPLIQGFENIGTVAFRRELKFRKEFGFLLSRRVIGFAATLLLAFALKSYWALVFGSVVTRFAGTLLSFVVHPYRPRACLSGASDLLNFSLWLLANNILIFLINRGADFVIGKVTGPTALGLYSVSYEIANLPTTELVFPISRAVFPGYVQMAAANVEELRQGFLAVLSVIVLFTVPAGVGICVLAEPLVYAVLGAKWQAAIPVVQILSVFGILRAVGSNSGSVYLALGIPKVLTYLALLFLAIMFSGLWILVPDHGALGAAYAVLLAAVLQSPLGFAVVMRKIDLRLPILLSAIWRPLIGAGVMAVAIVLVSNYPPVVDASHLTRLVALVPLGATIYAAAVLILWTIAGRPLGGETRLLAATWTLVDRLKKRGA